VGNVIYCFVGNLTDFPAVKGFWKSIKIWRNYRHNRVAHFLRLSVDEIDCCCCYYRTVVIVSMAQHHPAWQDAVQHPMLAVQAVCNGLPMSAAQGTTVHDRLLRLHLRHHSSAAPTVRRLLSAACVATPLFDVRSSGLFCGRPGGLELVTRLPSRSDVFCWQFSSWTENSSFLVLLAYTAH